MGTCRVANTMIILNRICKRRLTVCLRKKRFMPQKNPLNESLQEGRSVMMKGMIAIGRLRCTPRAKCGRQAWLLWQYSG